LALHGLGGETKIVLLAFIGCKVIISGTTLGLEVVQSGRQVTVLVKFSLGAAHELGLLHHLQVESAGELGRLVVVAGSLVTAAHEVTTSGFVSLGSAAKLELTGVGLLGELGGMLLGLVEVVVCGLDAAILITVFSSLHSVKVSAAFDLLLVARTLLLEFSKFVTGVIDFLAQGMAAIALLGNVALSSEDLSLATTDLLAGRGNLC